MLRQMLQKKKNREITEIINGYVTELIKKNDNCTKGVSKKCTVTLNTNTADIDISTGLAFCTTF